MRVLLDENMPERLRHLFGEEIEAETVGYRGWKSLGNGELMRAAEADYDAFITMDQGIPHQHDLTAFDLAVLVIRAASNEYDVVAPLLPAVREALSEAQAGAVVYLE